MFMAKVGIKYFQNPLDHSNGTYKSRIMTKREELIELQKLRGLIIGVMSGSVNASEIESYSIGEADGTQSVRRRSPKELMEWLESVDKKIAILERSLSGRGEIMTFGTDRYME
jgi:hypothetical protein